MKLRHLRARLLPSLKAVLAGWAAAMVVTFPMQIAKIVANSFGGPAVLLLSLAEGGVIWGLWGLALAAGGWLFGFLPVILLVPENWLLRHLRTSSALAAVVGWIVVLAEFQVWKLLLPGHHMALRMFTLYSLLFVVYATVSAFVYLRLIALERVNP
jgi:hypothetical protein